MTGNILQAPNPDVSTPDGVICRVTWTLPITAGK